MERNFETVMIEQCAPVLAGLKPAGLFRYETRDCADLAARVRRWNDQLGEKGLKVRVLKGCAQTHRYLIYVYRESRLRQVLADEAVREFLQREGYALPEDASDCDGMRSPMCGGISKIRAAITPATAAGRLTATPMPPHVILPS